MVFGATEVCVRVVETSDPARGRGPASEQTDLMAEARSGT